MACTLLPFNFSSAALNAAASQSGIALQHRVYSCSEVKKLYPELERLSRVELRQYLFDKFADQYNTHPMENYTYAKYYVCRSPMIMTR